MKLEISNGELIDKYTILMIKTERITDEMKSQRVKYELSTLVNYVKDLSAEFNVLDEHITTLLNVNKKLWDIEDFIRRKEYLNEFDAEFIELARSVYYTNDTRAEIKNKINTITNSAIHEVKHYVEYV